MKKYKYTKIIVFLLYLIIFSYNLYYFLLSLFAIFIHEISHILIAKIKNLGDIGINFSILGFKMNIDERNLDNNYFLLYAIGSIVNIFMALILFFVNLLLNVDFLRDFMIANFIIGIFNLLPAFPLDGGVIFRNILFGKFNYNLSNNISIGISFIISILICILGIILVRLNYMVNISYVLVGFVIFVYTYREYSLFKKFKVFTSHFNKEIDFRKNIYVNSFTISTNYDTRFLDIINKLKISKFIIIYCIDEKFNINGIVSYNEILNAYKNYGNISLKEYLYNKDEFKRNE